MEDFVRPIEVLIAQARNDRASLGELLEWYRGMLLVWWWRNMGAKLRKKYDPEDLVQEVLAKAIRGFPGFRGTTEPELTAWIRRIFANMLSDKLDSVSVADQAVRLDGPCAGWDTTTTFPRNEPAAQQTSPSQRLVKGEQAFRVARALATLPAAQQEVVCLRFFHGLSFKEIAERVGRSTDAIQGLYRRGLEALQGHLTDSSQA